MNLQAGDIPGFTSEGGEAETAKPRQLALEEVRCAGSPDPSLRIAQVDSTELSAGRGRHAEIVKSIVAVWPNTKLVTADNDPRRGSRARRCYERFLAAFHHRTNVEREGRMQIGPFTLEHFPSPLPGAANSFRRRVNETLLLSNGAIHARIYRDILGFTAGLAEVELEAIGFDHPIATPLEVRALRLLHARAVAHAAGLSQV